MMGHLQGQVPSGALADAILIQCGRPCWTPRKFAGIRREVLKGGKKGGGGPTA